MAPVNVTLRAPNGAFLVNVTGPPSPELVALVVVAVRDALTETLEQPPLAGHTWSMPLEVRGV